MKSIDIPNFLTLGLISNVGTNFTEAGDEAASTIKNELNLSDLVIILDDLERADPSLLSSNEILGYVNSLVEENNIKVIIIANDGIIKSEDYQIIKEKTIGHTIHFEKDFDRVFSDLINGKESNFDGAFRAHINDNKSLIFELLEKEWPNKNDINLRTLKYFLSLYSVIFYSVKTKFDLTELEERRRIIENNLIRFSLGITIEYKKGEITFRERQDIDNRTSFIIDYILERGNEKKVKTYLDKFYEKYFKETNHVFYDSVFSFITGGDTFDYEKLLDDLKSSFHIKETGNISEEDKLLQQLHGFDIYDLEDDESIEVHRGIYKFLLEGKYQTTEMPTLFYYLTADTCPISIVPKELCDGILHLLESKKNDHIYHPLLAQYLPINDDNPHSEHLMLIREKLLEINEQKALSEHKEKTISLKKIAECSFHEFCQTLMKDENQLRTFLRNLEPEFVFDTFISAKNRDKRLFNLAIYHRYISKSPYAYKSDYDFICSLSTLTDKYIAANQNNKMSTVLVRQLSKYINESIVTLDSIY